MGLLGFTHCFTAAPFRRALVEVNCTEDHVSDRSYLALRITCTTHSVVLSVNVYILNKSSLKMGASLVAPLGKNLPAMQEIGV